MRLLNFCITTLQALYFTALLLSKFTLYLVVYRYVRRKCTPAPTRAPPCCILTLLCIYPMYDLCRDKYAANNCDIKWYTVSNLRYGACHGACDGNSSAAQQWTPVGMPSALIA